MNASAALLFLAASCGGGGPGPDDAPDGGIDVSDLGYRPCDPATRVGTFRVDLEADFTGVQGSVADGVVPQNVPVLEDEEGGCRLYSPPALFCDPACVPGETCARDGTCIPYPSNRSVGTVTIAGLEVPLEMTPLAPANFYTNPDPLPHPGFAQGAGIELRAAGGDYEPLVLHGWGIGPLVPALDEILVEPGSPPSLAWDAPADPGPARVRISLDVNRHGASPMHVECDAVDTGAFEIPVSLSEALVGAGLSGFPLVTLWRRTADSTSIEPGCVELFVGSPVDLPVRVPGLDSCTRDEDCPDAETCRPDLTCG